MSATQYSFAYQRMEFKRLELVAARDAAPRSAQAAWNKRLQSHVAKMLQYEMGAS